jgi:hypothetical protein
MNVLPQVSQVIVTSSLCVLPCIIRLYGLVHRCWPYLQLDSHWPSFLCRNSWRSSSLIAFWRSAEGWVASGQHAHGTMSQVRFLQHIRMPIGRQDSSPLLVV